MILAYLFDRFPSTTETFLSREVVALQKLGFQIEIYALEAGEATRRIETPPAALKLGGKARFWRTTGEKLVPELQRHGITHIHATWANHITDIAMAAAQKSGLSWSFAAHARDLWVEGGDLKAKLASAKFGAVCTREGEAELLKHGENVLYAPHGLPLADFPFKEWEKERETRVLGVGRLVEKKGWMDLVAAAGLCAQLHPNAHFEFQIIGEGPLRGWLEKQIAALQLSNFKLSGALSPAEVVAAMQEANCFVMPSRRATDGDRDGLPNVLLEAAALGLPIITSDNEGARELVDEETARIFPATDAAALARALGSVRSLPGSTSERCRAARARVERDFDIEKNVEKLAEAFRS
jgi:glycosyltransferase involved in cell wall biosynthesis